MEIERKFLLNSLPQNLDKYECLSIEQAYISHSPTIRIRKINGTSFILTIKSKGAMAREEYELEMTKDEYETLLLKKDTSEIVITKKRYLIPLENKYTAELDVYENSLKGLYTVEVEFPSITECQAFIPPVWFGKDVTLDNRFKNGQLAKNGLPN